jgi:hypothetical protein
MADYNNHSHLLAEEKRRLAVNALDVVRRHDELHMNSLNSHVLDLTSKLASVQNERDETRAEMVSRGILQPENIRPGETTHLHPGDEQEVAAGIENRHTADDVLCALAMTIQQLNTRMTELISQIDELKFDLAYVTYERDQMRNWLAGGPWGRFRMFGREAFRNRNSNVVTDERPLRRRRIMLGVMGPLSLPVCSQSTNEESADT